MIKVSAGFSEGKEYAHLWDYVTKKHPPYLEYQEVTQRKIQIAVFEPMPCAGLGIINKYLDLIETAQPSAVLAIMSLRGALGFCRSSLPITEIASSGRTRTLLAKTWLSSYI